MLYFAPMFSPEIMNKIKRSNMQDAVDAYVNSEIDYFSSIQRQLTLKEMIAEAEDHQEDVSLEKRMLYAETVFTSIAQRELELFKNLKGIRAGNGEKKYLVGDIRRFSTDEYKDPDAPQHENGEFMICVSSLLSVRKNDGKSVVLKRPEYIGLSSLLEPDVSPTVIFDANADQEFLDAVEEMKETRLRNKMAKITVFDAD